MKKILMICTTAGCPGQIEAAAQIWFNLDEDGMWYIAGVGDEAASITCDEHGHDNYTPALGKSLEAHIAAVLPGTTWRETDPRLVPGATWSGTGDN